MSETAHPNNVAPAPPRPLRGAFLSKLEALRRDYGPSYAALAASRELAAWLPERIEERLLRLEGRRGVLGPAHRRWSEHSVSVNRDVWSGWDWAQGGEEWSASPVWKSALVAEVLLPAVDGAEVVLEIGPGAGRWTEQLHAVAERLVLVDITTTTLELCRRRLDDPPDVTYLHTDGSGLPGVADVSIGAVWSFDAFVHIAPIDIDAYLGEIRRVLVPGGRAVVHHTGRREPRGWRTPMGPRLFANLARSHDLEVVRQFDSWGGGRFGVTLPGDVITELRRPA